MNFVNKEQKQTNKIVYQVGMNITFSEFGIPAWLSYLYFTLKCIFFSLCLCFFCINVNYLIFLAFQNLVRERYWGIKIFYLGDSTMKLLLTSLCTWELWLVRYLSNKHIKLDETINKFLVYCHYVQQVISSSFYRDLTNLSYSWFYRSNRYFIEIIKLSIFWLLKI